MDLNDALVAALASSRFPTSRVREVAADSPNKLLSAVRAESEERFWSSLGAVLDAIDWTKMPSHPVKARHELLSLLAPLDFPTNGLIEHACDHFGYGDLVGLARMVDSPDAAFGLDVVRTVEAGDSAAAARVAERLDRVAVDRLTHGPVSDPVGAQRLYAAMRRRFEGDVASEIAFLAKNVASGMAGVGALFLTRRRGIELGEQPSFRQSPVPAQMRLLIQAALHLAPEMVGSLVCDFASSPWSKREVSVFECPWDAKFEVANDTQVYRGWRWGSLVLTATGKLEGGLPAPGRLSAKVYKSDVDAERDLQKKLAAQATKLGRPVTELRHAAHVPNRDELLLKYCQFDSGFDNVVELLAGGAQPDAVVDERGQSALHRAACTDSEVVRRLLVAGATPNGPTPDWTPVDSAIGAQGDSLIAMTHLLAAGGRPAPGQGAVARAAQKGLLRIVRALVEAGADPGETVRGKTAADYADEAGFARTAAFLRPHRPARSRPDVQPLTASA